MVKLLYKKIIKLIRGVALVSETNDINPIDSVSSGMAEDSEPAFDWDYKGLWGPFKSPEDISNFWHQFRERELKQMIRQAREDLSDSLTSEKDTKIYQQDIKEMTKELNDLRDFVDNCARCIERYKFDKKTLQQVQDDWYDFNGSLYSDWSHLQAFILGGALKRSEEERKESRERAKSERVKREEIERRMKMLLTT